MQLSTGIHVKDTDILHIARGDSVSETLKGYRLSAEEVGEVLVIARRWREIRTENEAEYAEYRRRELREIFGR